MIPADVAHQRFGGTVGVLNCKVQFDQSFYICRCGTMIRFTNAIYSSYCHKCQCDRICFILQMFRKNDDSKRLHNICNVRQPCHVPLVFAGLEKTTVILEVSQIHHSDWFE